MDTLRDENTGDIATAGFLMQLEEEENESNTIESKLCALNKARDDLRTTGAVTARTLRAIKRRGARPPDNREPLNSTDVYKMVEAGSRLLEEYQSLGRSRRTEGSTDQARRQDLKQRMQRFAACVLAFTLLLRQGTARALEGRDVVLSGSDKIIVTLRKVKHQSFPRDKTLHGPIQVWFRKLIQESVISISHQGRLFHLLPEYDPNEWLKICLASLKIRPPPGKSYSFHSLRIGGTTALTRPGTPVPIENVRLLGCWKSTDGMRSYQRFESKDGDFNSFFWRFLCPQELTWTT